jgi:para-nitrobenzyl esterase
MDTIVGFTRDELTAFGAPLAPRRDDKLFAIPTLEWARRAAGAGRNVHLYRFDWAGPDSGVGACHCIELPFVFGTRRAFDGALMLRGGDPAEIDTLSAAMGSAWAAFARSGDLTASELAAWPRLGSGGGDAMILDAACRTVEASGLA